MSEVCTEFIMRVPHTTQYENCPAILRKVELTCHSVDKTDYKGYNEIV
jgi:hypothetical protein